MKKELLLLTLAWCIVGVGYAQDKSDQDVIDQQVWVPFMESWSGCNAKEFNALHTDDVLRAGGHGVQVGDEYKSRIKTSFSTCKERQPNRKIEFTFIQRNSNGMIGYEVGYFKVSASASDGNKKYFYGQFHVVVRKENNIWKIAQDWDTDKLGDRPINEQDYLSGEPLAIQ